MSEQAKHTPEPWYVADGFVFSENGLRVADCQCDGQEDEMSEEEIAANAAIIAAAPDLFEACEAVIRWASTPGDHGGNPYCKEFVKLAEKSLAKAKGQS